MVKQPAIKQSEIILYTTTNGDVKLEVFLHDETMWLTQKQKRTVYGADYMEKFS